MFAGNLLQFGFSGRSLASMFPAARLGRFVLGGALGVITASMWQQFSLTFGLDPILLIAVGLVLAVALGLGQRWSSRMVRGSATGTLVGLLGLLGAWSLIHPFWVNTLATSLSRVPLSWFESPVIHPLVSLLVAGMVWLLPGLLSGAIMALGMVDASHTRRSSPALMFGIACGLVVNAVVLAPWVGLQVASLAATGFVCALGLGRYWLRLTQGEREVVDPSRGNHATNPADELVGLRGIMAVVIGVLLACQIRLINQLMPHGAFMVLIQSAGLLAGLAVGISILSFRRVALPRWDVTAWSGLLAASASSLLLALHPALVNASLWMNATLTNVVWLMLARVALLMLALVPFGVALAGVARPRNSEQPQVSLGWGTPFVLGVTGGTFLLGGIVDMIPLMGLCSGLLLGAIGYLHICRSGWIHSARTAGLAGSLLAVALSLPFWRLHDDASRTAKVLFSTPAFVAYRSGWNINHLSALDDLRLIHRRESSSGSLTLWRGHVAELYVREGGVPRAVVSKSTEIVPQFAPEVLQAVYSLVISERPGRVLLLGLSAGVPLSTCLQFPVRELVCVEGDSQLIELVRGPLARETGLDPLVDDRVKLQRVSPELALMAQPGDPFDVILSSPASSSLSASGVNFTSEFYQRASKHLAERGLFCQRFECVDYGPEPLRIVLKSMRQAFRQVMAIETAAGEMLLFGANSDEVFIPGGIAARLELPHVLKVLSRSGLDWSTLLNQPAYDHEALGEICGESRQSANSTFNGLLGGQAPWEVMRWGNKLMEVQASLTTTRLTKAPFWTAPADGEPHSLDQEVTLSRRSRLVEWLGDAQVSLELLRRLNEVTTQQKLVHENPDAHWWEYRKTLRQQLQERPRTLVQQVKAIEEKRTLHPEDIRRRDYFSVLGNAVQREKPTREQIAAVEAYLEPYDPLLSYFAKQEIADLLARCDEDAAQELTYRLHVIFFAPTRDASVRNVATALETLVKHPEAIPNDSTRFDVLNGLVQTLRTRWETRQFITETSTRKVLVDVDQSLIAIENGVSSLNEIAASAGVTEAEWEIRKQVIERLLLRPLRSYRAEIKGRQDRSQLHARAVFADAERVDEQQESNAP